MLDQEFFKKCMGILTAAYLDYEFKPDTMEIYRQTLINLTDVELERAIWVHVTTRKWFPKISELLDAVREQHPSPIEIWQELITAAERGQKPELDEATEKALTAIGGWEVFQFTPYAELQFKYKDFRIAYLEARARQNLVLVEGHARAVLPGPDAEPEPA